MPQKYACLPVAISMGATSARQAGVGADELGALHHQIGGLGQRIQRIGAALTHHHIIGVHVVHGDACVVEGVEQTRLADGEHGAARRLLLQEGGGGQRTGVEMLLRHVQSHPCQLLVQLPGRVAAVVGEKEILLVLLVQPVDELRHARQNTIAVVDHTVHIADEALFLVEIDGSMHICSPLYQR